MSKRHTVIILLLTLLAVTTVLSAGAKVRKRKKHKHSQEQITDTKADTAKVIVTHELTKKEKRKKEKEERKKLKKERKHMQEIGVKTTSAKSRPLIKPREEIIYPASHIKYRYRIDVLAQLYLDELVKGKYITYSDKLPDKAVPGIAFAEGVNIAADSLKKAGYNVTIYVHDAASFHESAEILVMQGKLDSADLIIGAVDAKDIPVLAAFAKKKQIYFISALSASDGGVSGNPYFTLLQPSLKAHCQWLVKDITRKYPENKITVLYRNSTPEEKNAYSWLTADSGKTFAYQPLLCDSVPTRQQLLPLFDLAKTNIILMPVLDILYADSLLKSIAHSFPDTHFEIYGMPSWEDITDLHKAAAFPNFSVTITDPFNFNSASTSGIYIEHNFKKDYSGKPSELVYRGYETLLWYANLLKRYGTIFKYTDNAPTPFTPFEITPQWDKNNGLLYNENKHLFLTKYEKGKGKKE